MDTLYLCIYVCVYMCMERERETVAIYARAHVRAFNVTHVPTVHVWIDIYVSVRAYRLRIDASI